MNFIFRTGGLICAMLFATASLYFFTAFWSGIGSQIKIERTVTGVSQQAYTQISSIKRTDEEKCSNQEV